MKKGRFLWSAHRITEKQKAGKARNIKEKQLKNSRSTVSKQLVVLHSSANVNLLLLFRTRFIYSSERDCSEEFLYTRATDQSLCWHKPLQAVGKLLERFWQDCGKTMADCQDNLSDSE